MGYVIDSDVLIEMEKGNFNFEKLIRGKEDEEFFISVITASELLHGVLRAKTAEQRMKRSSFVENLLRSVPILQIDLSVARTHSKIMAETYEAKASVGVHDSWIAATCIANGLTLITRNKKDFEKFPGLGLKVVR